MTVLWLAALSPLSPNRSLIPVLRHKIVDQIAAVATWTAGSTILPRFTAATRVAWTGLIQLSDIPPADTLVYFVNKTDARLLGTAPVDAAGFTQVVTDSNSWSEVFIERIDQQMGLLLRSPGLEKVDMAAAAFGAAALHEAMHNKIEPAMWHAGHSNFDLHRRSDGGGGVASKSLKDCFKAEGLLDKKDPTFRIDANQRNKALLRNHLDFRIPQQFRKDAKTEAFHLVMGRPPPPK